MHATVLVSSVNLYHTIITLSLQKQYTNFMVVKGMDLTCYCSMLIFPPRHDFSLTACTAVTTSGKSRGLRGFHGTPFGRTIASTVEDVEGFL